MKDDKKLKAQELRKKLLALDDNEWKKVLDTSDDKTEGYWNKVAAMNLTRSPEIRRKAVENTNWEVRNKNLSKARKGKLNEGLQKTNILKRTPIEAYKVTHNGLKKDNFKFLSQEYFKTYESVTEASLDLKIASGIIHNILNPDHSSKQVKGWLFKYVNNDKRG